jgi:cytochrome b
MRMEQSETPVAVKVWDLPVRIFHWALLAIFALQAVTGWIGGALMQWHLYCGYALLILVVFRILWGFAGSTHARFSSFIAGPGATMRFAKRLFSRQAVPQLGHNPLGGWSVILMLASLALQGATGLVANDGVMTEGPLAKWFAIETSNMLAEVHRWNFWVLVVLSSLHTAAVVFHLVVKKDDVLKPMFTGVKQVPAALIRERREAKRGSPLRRAASRELSAYHDPGWRRAALILAIAFTLVAVLVSAGR